MAGFNECTRVRISAALHLSRLGYFFFADYGEGTPVDRLDKNNNILTDEFLKALVCFNSEQKFHCLQIFVKFVLSELGGDDFGREFPKQIEVLTIRRNTLLPLFMISQIEV